MAFGRCPDLNIVGGICFSPHGEGTRQSSAVVRALQSPDFDVVFVHATPILNHVAMVDRCDRALATTKAQLVLFSGQMIPETTLTHYRTLVNRFPGRVHFLGEIDRNGVPTDFVTAVLSGTGVPTLEELSLEVLHGLLPFVLAGPNQVEGRPPGFEGAVSSNIEKADASEWTGYDAHVKAVDSRLKDRATAVSEKWTLLSLSAPATLNEALDRLRGAGDKKKDALAALRDQLLD